LLLKNGNNTANTESLLFSSHMFSPVVIVIEAPQASSVFFGNSMVRCQFI